jgi:hypothetical protein
VLKDKDLEFANSIRPLSAHETRGAMLPASRAQKLSLQINVELVVGLEVFGQHTDRIASQPPLAAHCRSRLWLTQNLDDLGKSRQLPMLKA